METSQLICTVNQLTGFFMRATLTLSGLQNIFWQAPLRQISLAGIGLKVGCGTESCPALGEGLYCEMRDISSVIRQKGESQNGCSKKQNTPNFPNTRTYVCASGGKKCLFFGKFGVLCFLGTLVFRFALLPYYRRFWWAIWESRKHLIHLLTIIIFKVSIAVARPYPGFVFRKLVFWNINWFYTDAGMFYKSVIFLLVIA